MKGKHEREARTHCSPHHMCRKAACPETRTPTPENKSTDTMLRGSDVAREDQLMEDVRTITITGLAPISLPRDSNTRSSVPLIALLMVSRKPPRFCGPVLASIGATVAMVLRAVLSLSQRQRSELPTTCTSTRLTQYLKSNLAGGL